MNPIQSVAMNPTQESQTLNLGHNAILGSTEESFLPLQGSLMDSVTAGKRIKSQEKIPVNLFPTQNTRTKR